MQARVLLTLSVLGASVAVADDSAVEQHIARIQNALLPPVRVVTGESLQTSKLADRMAALHVPGVSIAMIHAGRIEWARGFGVTKAGGSAVTPDTLFQAASISKAVSALGVLRLVQEGRLDLDADVNGYLKTWKVPANALTSKAPVTLRELLTHSAGMTVHGFEGYAAGQSLPTLVQVLNGERPANNQPIGVATVPGTAWSYSGGGYLVAQQVVFDVTGIPFPRFMQDRVLGPLQMSNSSFDQPLPAALLTAAAMPHLDDGRPVKGGPHVYPELAAAGLWTTPTDLARYAIGVQQALSGQSPQVISMLTARAMLTPGSDHLPGLKSQGLGPMLGGSADHAYFTHSGANEGYRCQLVAYQVGDGVVIMTNGNGGEPLMTEILGTLASEYGWPDFLPPERALGTADPKVFARYAGTYRLDSGLPFKFSQHGKQFYMEIAGEQKLEMFPTSSEEYFLKAMNVRIVFVPDSDGTAHSVIVYQDGEEIRGKR